MKGVHLAIVGCGDLGQRVAARLAGESLRITGLRRDPSRLPPGVEGVAADYADPASLAVLETLAPDYLLLTLKPLGRDAAAYAAGFDRATAAVLDGLGKHRPRGILMVSSTRVYAENAGGWVDENSPLNTEDPAALAIIRAEHRLLDPEGRAPDRRTPDSRTPDGRTPDSRTSVCVVRSAGLYGSETPRLLPRVASGDFSPASPLRYANRIHRDDLAGLLVHLLRAREAGQAWPPVVNAVDDAPVSQQEVEGWLAQALGMPAPTGDAPESGVQAQGKRCRNRVLHACDYHLMYPDYRSGYRDAIASWRTAH